MTVPRQPEQEGPQPDLQNNNNRDDKSHLSLVPSDEEAKAANRGDYAPGKTRGFLENLARNWAVRFGLVGGLGGAYEAIPAVHQFVDNTYHESMQALEVEVPSTFDNKADKGVIGANNTVKVPQAEIDKQFPTAFAKINLGNKTIVSLPQKAPPGADKSMYPDVKVAVGDKISTLQLEYPLSLTALE